jgi:hypothetical protein
VIDGNEAEGIIIDFFVAGHYLCGSKKFQFRESSRLDAMKCPTIGSIKHTLEYTIYSEYMFLLSLLFCVDTPINWLHNPENRP